MLIIVYSAQTLRVLHILYGELPWKRHEPMYHVLFHWPTLDLMLYSTCAHNQAIHPHIQAYKSPYFLLGIS